MLESDKINQGAATNHIRFDCVGSTLTLYVNGFQVDQQTDTDYTTGNVGLTWHGTFETTSELPDHPCSITFNCRYKPSIR